MFSGYKTYILAGVSIITALAGYLVGDLPLADAIQIAVTAGLGATIRDGIKKTIN